MLTRSGKRLPGISLAPALFLLATLSGVSAQEDAVGNPENLEAVIETDRGQIVIEFFPKDAPRHVEYFIKQAKAGAYDGTTFHRLLKNGLIQGGDPLSKNPAARARYGTGGLNAGIPDEVNKHKHIPGAVSAVMSEDRSRPKGVKPGSSGTQFFIVLSPQPSLDSVFTVFGRVVEGMDVAKAISNAPANASYIARDRIEIKKVTVREKTPAVEQMKAMTATLETSLGNIKLQFAPEGAPNTTRAFIRNAKSGLYDGTTFFRISHKYYLEAGNLAEWPADSPNRQRFFSLWQIPAEQGSLKQERGVLSLRPAEAGMTGWIFVLLAKDNPALEGKQVPIAKVVEGLDVVDKIAEAEVEGDKPKQRIEIRKITVQ
ncbi:MAG TPA: peptidylprolyl isomerase [Blastocatellia bacterium]|nr:peptidylprolyl isomerase [Blastocatellia bacterium]